MTIRSFDWGFYVPVVDVLLYCSFAVQVTRPLACESLRVCVCLCVCVSDGCVLTVLGFYMFELCLDGFPFGSFRMLL